MERACPIRIRTILTDNGKEFTDRLFGLEGVKLVISDAHSGLKGAISRVFEATWQRCRVHWMRNALAYVSKGQHTVVAAAIRQVFDQPDRTHAGETWRKVAEQLRPRWPRLADLMDEAEHDVLAYMAFPRQHRTKLHSTNPIERLNKEVKRRADVVGPRALSRTDGARTLDPERGLIVDGPCTDLSEIEESDFPMWARGLSPITTRIYDLGGGMNIPVSCGGAVVMPGDAVLADESGVLVLPRSEARAVAERALSIQTTGKAREARVRNREVKLGDLSGASAKVLAKLAG